MTFFSKGVCSIRVVEQAPYIKCTNNGTIQNLDGKKDFLAILLITFDSLQQFRRQTQLRHN